MTELDGSALESLVRDLAADPQVWEHLVQHSPDQRDYEELRRDDDVAVWLICWMDDHDTGFHDHDLSGGAVAVVPGRGRRGPARTRRSAGDADVRRAGEAFHFSAADIHRVRHTGATPGGDDPRLLAAAVAHGRLRGPARRRAAAALAVLRRGVAPAARRPEHLLVSPS